MQYASHVAQHEVQQFRLSRPKDSRKSLIRIGLAWLGRTTAETHGAAPPVPSILVYRAVQHVENELTEL
jgi:hypothetical protein